MGRGILEVSIKYVHTNIIARDWKKLADFYIQVFGCTPVPPERDISGEWIDEMTGISSVRIRGAHLRLPGYEDGPTLEIFTYEPGETDTEFSGINLLGFGHIAFHVDDIEAVLAVLLTHGGTKFGGLVTKEYEGFGTFAGVYARDPEGNIIEIQNWKRLRPGYPE